MKPAPTLQEAASILATDHPLMHARRRHTEILRYRASASHYHRTANEMHDLMPHLATTYRELAAAYERAATMLEAVTE